MSVQSIVQTGIEYACSFRRDICSVNTNLRPVEFAVRTR